MTERAPSSQSTSTEATSSDTASSGDAQASAASFTTSGAIPSVSSAAGGAAPSASDRAFGAHAASVHHPHHGIPGGDRTVSMEHINTRHRADGQSTRLAIGGKTPVVASATHVYGNDGKQLGNVAPGRARSASAG